MSDLLSLLCIATLHKNGEFSNPINEKNYSAAQNWQLAVNGREQIHFTRVNETVAPMTSLRRCPQVSNWRESCMISPWSHHAVTDHPARHDLSLPAACRLWRAPNDAPS